MLSAAEGLALFGAYAAAIVALVWTTRHNDVYDFLVMRRQLGIVQGALSIAVSWIWAPAVFICSLQAYQQGLPGIFWFTAPNILCFFVFIPVALKLRSLFPEGFTVSQAFRESFPSDSRPHLAALFVALGYQLGAVIINCVAGATLINLLTGVPYLVAVVLMGGVSLTYCLISGLRASVLSDVVQMAMIIVVGFIVVPWSIHVAGGWSVLRQGVGGVSGNYANLLDPGVAFSFGIATSIGLISGPVADQMFSQRAYAAREKAILPIFALGGLLFGVVPIVLSLLGFLGAGAIRMGESLVVADPQMVGPAVVAHYLPKAALMLFAVMAFAGLTSTLDSAFSAIGSLWAVDLLPYRREPKRELSVGAARTGMVVFAVLGLSVAALQPQLLWVFLVYGALAASLFLPLLFTLFGRSPRSGPVFLGISLGVVIGTPLSIYANVTGNTGLIVLAAVLGLLVPGLVVIVAGRLVR